MIPASIAMGMKGLSFGCASLVLNMDPCSGVWPGSDQNCSSEIPRRNVNAKKEMCFYFCWVLGKSRFRNYGALQCGSGFMLEHARMESYTLISLFKIIFSNAQLGEPTRLMDLWESRGSPALPWRQTSLGLHRRSNTWLCDLAWTTICLRCSVSSV